MTGVLVLGDIPSTGIAGTTAERVVLGTSRAPGSGAQTSAPGHASDDPKDPLDAFLDLVGQRLDRAKVVIAIYPAWRPDPARRYIQFARSALETEWLVGVPTDLPPLALSLVADQLAYLAPYVPPGVLVGLLSRLTQETLAGAWVRSVARLERVSTSLGQHVRSYLPGGFMVTASPRPDVHRVTAGTPVGELFFRPADPLQVLATRGDGDAAWFENRLLPSVRPARVQFFEPQPFSVAYWGTRKYIEYVAFSSHPQALAYAAGTIRVRRCRWCEQVVATATCPFCGMTRHRTGQRAPAQQGVQQPVQPAVQQPVQPAVQQTARHDTPGVHPKTSQASPAVQNSVDGRGSVSSGPAPPTGPLPSPTEPGSGVP